MKKRNRCFTLMIVPHSERETTYSIKLPLFVGQIAVLAVALALAGVLILAFTYRNTLAEAEEARMLRQINQVQQDEINAFAHETQKLLEQMSQIEDLAELVADKLGIDLEPRAGEGDGGDSSGEDNGEKVRAAYASRSAEGGVLDRAAGNIAVLQVILPEQAGSLETLKGEVEEHIRRLAATPSIWPAHGRLSSGFGTRRSPFNRNIWEFHRGVDIVGGFGSSIYATADGVISYVGYRGGFGNLVIINHGYGFQTYYAHLSRFAVSSGQWVRRGQVIGYMGRTGRVTGTHLHYEVHVNGVAVNPLNYMR